MMTMTIVYISQVENHDMADSSRKYNEFIHIQYRRIV